MPVLSCVSFCTSLLCSISWLFPLPLSLVDAVFDVGLLMRCVDSRKAMEEQKSVESVSGSEMVMDVDKCASR